MHPIERLRYVARAGPVGHLTLVEETAGALAGFGDDIPGLVMASRRLIERNPASGPLWTLCARVLCAGDVWTEAQRTVDDVVGDPTPGHLDRTLPDDGRLTVIGWPELTATALQRRGDVETFVVDAEGEGHQLARFLSRSGGVAIGVAEAGTGHAVRSSDLVVVEADAAGPDAAVAVAGSYAAAAVARHAGVPVWLVVGEGRALPRPVWEGVTARLDAAAPVPGTARHDLVPFSLFDAVVGPSGSTSPADAEGRADGPVAPELLR